MSFAPHITMESDISQVILTESRKAEVAPTEKAQCRKFLAAQPRRNAGINPLSSSPLSLHLPQDAGIPINNECLRTRP
ncbi:MAG: hypothetical protein ABW106_15735 [Steroidobacteraceae bacterium]